MKIFHGQIVDFWLSEPTVKPRAKMGFNEMWHTPYFPPFNRLSFREKKKFKILLAKHPEYLLHQIETEGLIQ
jgi:hypothetical protein